MLILSHSAGQAGEFEYVNVTKNQVFPVSWSLWVNHNNPPQPVGFVEFNFAAEGSEGDFKPIATTQNVVNQPINEYYVENIVVPAVPGRGIVQVKYDINGADSPFPAYYQCIDIWVQ